MRADLSRAQLSWMDLSGADFRGAEGFQAVYPYDPNRTGPAWLDSSSVVTGTCQRLWRWIGRRVIWRSNLGLRR